MEITFGQWVGIVILALFTIIETWGYIEKQPRLFIRKNGDYLVVNDFLELLVFASSNIDDATSFLFINPLAYYVCRGANRIDAYPSEDGKWEIKKMHYITGVSVKSAMKQSLKRLLRKDKKNVKTDNNKSNNK